MKNKLNKRKNLKKILLIFCIITVLALLSGLIVFISIYNKYDLDIDELTSVNNGIRVYSATGQDTTLYNTNRSIIEIETLPDYVVQAFVDVEDKRFYEHNGYDLKRIVKAGLVNIASKSKSQGASTISQQLIKNALLTNEKTFARKIKEVILAIKLEKKFTKQDILEMYLNTIYFGSNAYGIENASKIYFNKSAKDLTLNEACCLAGLIKSPAYYSPKININNAEKRKNLVASLMLQNNHISNEEYHKVLNCNIITANNIESDHSYEEEAIFEACKLLNLTERELINKKYQIVTFKDDKLQQESIKINNNVINNSSEQYNTNLDSASIIVNNKNQVISYYVNSNYNLHNMKRQPASILKPLAVYLPAISRNMLSPSDLILDEKINYNGFEPNNADMKFHGYISARYALANSLNIPSVKLLDCLGLTKSKEMLTNLGINIEKEDLNLTLALGAMKYGTSLFDLVSAYSTIANNGNYRQLCFVNKILDKHGNIIYSYDDFTQKVVDEESCFLLTDMLKETAITGTAKKMQNLNLPIASKTGTANNGTYNTDLYNVTYSTEHTMLTWIANIKDNKLPNEMLSSSQPTEINKEICAYLYPNGVKDFTKPEGIEKMAYDLIEYEQNHRIVAPTQSLDRYIAYDYFKSNNPPIVIETSNETKFNVELSEKGANLTFAPKKNLTYYLCKKIKENNQIIATIKDSSEMFNLIDNDIFNYTEIEYYLKNENDEIISEQIKIRPKEYLINMLNNTISSGKYKWYI